MKKIIRAGGIFYAIGLVGIAIQQFIYQAFRPVILPTWPFHTPANGFWAIFIGLFFILAAIAIILDWQAERASLLLGGLLLIFFLVAQVPFEILYNPYNGHLGTWTDPIKELALSGGALIIAGSFRRENENPGSVSKLMQLLRRVVPAGRIFFSVMLILFGIDHFLYTDFVSKLVPSWMPGPLFWTYFAGIALAGGGLSMLSGIAIRPVSLLTALMIFIWLLVLHIPRAVSDPYSGTGNEITSVFEALAFSGIALVIAEMYSPAKKKV